MATTREDAMRGKDAGRGRLFYVMGPSGAGKDSVLGYVRKRLEDPGAYPGVVFAHRYITRRADAGGENHVELTEAEYAHRLAAGLFALEWDSHGFRYALGREIDLWMDAGQHVVVNGSRGFFPEAARRYPDISPVLVTVSPEVLRARLVGRGREDDEEIARRLRRAEEFRVEHPQLAVVDNGGVLEESGRALLALLRSRPAPPNTP